MLFELSHTRRPQVILTITLGGSGAWVKDTLRAGHGQQLKEGVDAKNNSDAALVSAILVMLMLRDC